MLNVIHGNIFDAKTGIICHGVNCQRVMGSGIAAAIRQRWPVVYEKYLEMPDLKGKLLGEVQLVAVEDDLYVANCFTQENFGSDGKKYANLDAIKRSIEYVLTVAERNTAIVHVPKIGAGLGGLDWETEVFPAIAQLSDQHPQRGCHYLRIPLKCSMSYTIQHNSCHYELSGFLINIKEQGAQFHGIFKE